MTALPYGWTCIFKKNMKKNKLTAILLLVLLFANGADLHAQWVQPVEGELRTGFTYPLAAVDGYQNLLHFGMVGAELRYNFRNLPMDAGVEMIYTMACRQSLVDENDKLPLRIWTISLTGDYNFNQSEPFSWFAGVGIGPAQRLVTSPFFGYYEDIPIVGAVFSPRVGIELWNQLRIMLCAHITSRDFNSLEVSVGYAVGGRPRKEKLILQDRNDPFYDPAFD